MGVQINGFSFTFSDLTKLVAGGIGVGITGLFIYTASQIDGLRDDVNASIATLDKRATENYTIVVELRSDLKSGLRLVETRDGLQSAIVEQHRAMIDRLAEQIRQIELTVASNRRLLNPEGTDFALPPPTRQPQE